MSIKMQAAVVQQFREPLVLREWDIPSPAAGQILVKTEACGVCHTDLHAMHGDWPVKPTLPFHVTTPTRVTSPRCTLAMTVLGTNTFQLSAA